MSIDILIFKLSVLECTSADANRAFGGSICGGVGLHRDGERDNVGNP